MLNARSVLILSYPFPPMAAAGAFRSARFVRYLRDFGWEALVLAGPPEGVAAGQPDPSLEALVPAGTVVQRVGLWRPVEAAKSFVRFLLRGRKRVPGDSGPRVALNPAAQPVGSGEQREKRFLQRVSDACDWVFCTPDRLVGWLLPAAWAALRMVRRFRPQVIYSTSPPNTSHLVGAIVKRITGLPLICDFRDPWARQQWRCGAQSTLRMRLHRRLEALCVRSSDLVILNTPRLRDEFCSFYDSTPADKFVVIPNGYDVPVFSGIEAPSKCAPVARRTGSIHLCHPGTVYGRRDLRPLTEAIAVLDQSGHSVELEQIGLVQQDYGLWLRLWGNSAESHVHLAGRLPHDETLRRMMMADLFVVIQPDTAVQVPGKLYEMLPFRKPIVALTGAGATADIIGEYRLGVVADPKDPQAIASAILRAAEMRPNGEDKDGWDRALQAFDGRALTASLADALNRVSYRCVRIRRR